MLKQAADKSSVDIFISGTWKVLLFQKILKIWIQNWKHEKRWKFTPRLWYDDQLVQISSPDTLTGRDTARELRL